MQKSFIERIERVCELKELFSKAPSRVSFEFFPPKNLEMEAKLWLAVTRLQSLNPAFVSVTYGAGGTTRERTHNTVIRLKKETALTPAAHLTCVGASKGEVDEVAREYYDAGIRHIVALRGDASDAQRGYEPHPQGYAYASDLVAGLRKIGDFDISVAGYPEGHPEAPSIDVDITHLQKKIDVGANRIITQYFFDADVFLRYLEKVRARNIDVPVVAGILPVTNFAQVKRFSKMCGASVPQWMAELFEGLDANPELRHLISAFIAAEQCRLLRSAGIEEFHFYTLNRARLTLAICHILGIRGQVDALKA
jgi:methylenetetrahydrofolate reductase (NADPH)